jgi:hypothetical protein
MHVQDWFILSFVALMWAVATVYLFIHPGEAVFASWCGLGATMGSVYHWLTIRDAKIKDAGNG